MRRSNQLVLAGIAFFVVGVIIVIMVAQGDRIVGDSGKPTYTITQTTNQQGDPCVAYVDNNNKWGSVSCVAKGTG